MLCWLICRSCLLCSRAGKQQDTGLPAAAMCTDILERHWAVRDRIHVMNPRDFSCLHFVLQAFFDTPLHTGHVYNANLNQTCPERIENSTVHRYSCHVHAQYMLRTLWHCMHGKIAPGVSIVTRHSVCTIRYVTMWMLFPTPFAVCPPYRLT